MIKSYIPRVAAVNDISGFGRVSLAEACPILSAMGIEVCPLPTAVLSTHTYKFTDYTFCDMTFQTEQIVDHWRKLDIQFDGICTGYMASAKQIEILSEFIKEEKTKGTLVVIDPVLGDNELADVEEIYYDRMSDLLAAMKSYAALADVITPNLTEACLLLGESYPKEYITAEELKSMMKRLSELGPDGVAVTSVMLDKNTMCVGVYDRKTDASYLFDCGFVNRPFHGTGDIFTAVLTGALVKGNDIKASAEIAVDFVRAAIAETLKYPEIKIEHGVVFEKVLGRLSSGKTEILPGNAF